MTYTVVFTPEAAEQLVALYRYIAAAASPEMAERYTGAIVTFCEGLQRFPHRGAAVGMTYALACASRTTKVGP